MKMKRLRRNFRCIDALMRQHVRCIYDSHEFCENVVEIVFAFAYIHYYNRLSTTLLSRYLSLLHDITEFIQLN